MSLIFTPHADDDMSDVALSLISANTSTRKANEMSFRARPVRDLISEAGKTKHGLNLRSKSDSRDDNNYLDSENTGKALFRHFDVERKFGHALRHRKGSKTDICWLTKLIIAFSLKFSWTLSLSLLEVQPAFTRKFTNKSWSNFTTRKWLISQWRPFHCFKTSLNWDFNSNAINFLSTLVWIPHKNWIGENLIMCTSHEPKRGGHSTGNNSINASSNTAFNRILTPVGWICNLVCAVFILCVCVLKYAADTCLW